MTAKIEKLRNQASINPVADTKRELMKQRAQNTLETFKRHLGLDVDALTAYLHERYYEQIVPILWSEDSSLYYDLIIE